jgi:type IV pilus assembly protein PilB
MSMEQPPPNFRSVAGNGDGISSGLRTVGGPGLPATSPWDNSGVNELAELIFDLLASTELLSADKLQAARSRAGAGSLAQALVDEGVASAGAVAQALARRHGLPFVDLTQDRVVPDAAQLIPLHVLQRIVAVPYSVDPSGRLRVAVADPRNIQGLDELRIATRHTLEFAVASRDDILGELAKLSRAGEVMDTQSVLDEIQVVEEEDDLDAEDGVSDAPLVRLVNSIIFQAAADGASDIHFAPQEDALVVRVSSASRSAWRSA